MAKKNDRNKAADWETIRGILEGTIPWPAELTTMQPYQRVHDDNDGDYGQRLSIGFGPDGDAHICVLGQTKTALRFRNSTGGTMSSRVYNAMMILAEAIRLDNEENQQFEFELPMG